MFSVQGTEDVRVSIRRSVQHRVVVGVRENYWLDDQRLDQVGGIGKGPGKACRLRRRDPVTFAESRVHQDALEFV
jgi:hypothetical protein